MMACDKCGGTVPIENDATALAVLLVRRDDERGALVLSMAQPRHLLPIPGCSGTPSKAQYIDGQPRCETGEYEPHIEVPIRSAYVKLQQLAALIG